MKKNLLKTSMISVAAAVVIAMTGCGGGGGSSSGSSDSSSSGSVADGYIVGAKVCLDLNKSGTCDAGEPFDNNTTEEGKYFFSVSSADIAKAKANHASILVVGGKDKDTGEDLNGTLKVPFATGSNVNITPLTTLVASMPTTNSSNSAGVIAGAVGTSGASTDPYYKAAKVLGVSESDLKGDPVALAKQGKTDAIAKGMTVQRVVVAMAGAVGGKPSKIYGNLGNTISKSNPDKPMKVSGIAQKAAESSNDPKLKAAAAAASIIEDSVINAIESGTPIADVAKAANAATNTIAKAAADGKSVDDIKKEAADAAIKQMAGNKPQVILGSMIFGNSDKNITVKLPKILGISKFDDVNIALTPDNNISDYFNVTLSDISETNVTDTFPEQNISLSFDIVDRNNNENNLTLNVGKVTVKYSEGSDTNLSVEIPEGTKVTLEQNGVKIIKDGDPVSYTTNDKLSYDKLTVNDILDKLSDANKDEIKNNLNKYFNKVGSYDVRIKMGDLNTSQVYVPFTEIAGTVNIRPELTFETIEVTNGDDSVNIDLNISDNKATFDPVKLTTSDDNITDFNLTLSNFNVTDKFDEQNVSVSFGIVDASNNDNNLTLNIDQALIKYSEDSDTNLSIVIPEGTKVTLEQNGVTIVNNGDPVSYTTSADLNSSNLSLNIQKFLDKLDIDSDKQDELKNNLNKYFDANRTYKLYIKINDINDSQVYFPFTSIEGNVTIEHN
jgi:ribosomal protein L9